MQRSLFLNPDVSTGGVVGRVPFSQLEAAVQAVATLNSGLSTPENPIDGQVWAKDNGDGTTTDMVYADDAWVERWTTQTLNKMPMLTGAGAVEGVYPIGGILQTITPINQASYTLPNYGTWLVLYWERNDVTALRLATLSVHSGGQVFIKSNYATQMGISAFRIA